MMIDFHEKMNAEATHAGNPILRFLFNMIIPF